MFGIAIAFFALTFGLIRLCDGLAEKGEKR